MLDARALQRDLMEVFDRHQVNVAVGLLRGERGVAIRSQDWHVSALDVGTVVAYGKVVPSA